MSDTIALRARYEELTGKNVSPRFSNDVEWLERAISEAEAGKGDQDIVPEKIVPEKKEETIEVFNLPISEKTPVHELYPHKIYKEKLYLIDDGKRIKCQLTGEIIGLGSASNVIALKEGKKCYLVVKKGIDLTKYGFNS